MDDVLAENPTNEKAPNEDQQAPTKAQIGAGVDDQFERNSDKFMNSFSTP